VVGLRTYRKKTHLGDGEGKHTEGIKGHADPLDGHRERLFAIKASIGAGDLMEELIEGC